MKTSFANSVKSAGLTVKAWGRKSLTWTKETVTKGYKYVSIKVKAWGRKPLEWITTSKFNWVEKTKIYLGEASMLGFSMFGVLFIVVATAIGTLLLATGNPMAFGIVPADIMLAMGYLSAALLITFAGYIISAVALATLRFIQKNLPAVKELQEKLFNDYQAALENRRVNKLRAKDEAKEEAKKETQEPKATIKETLAEVVDTTVEATKETFGTLGDRLDISKLSTAAAAAVNK